MKSFALAAFVLVQPLTLFYVCQQETVYKLCRIEFEFERAKVQRPFLLHIFAKATKVTAKKG